MKLKSNKQWPNTSSNSLSTVLLFNLICISSVHCFATCPSAQLINSLVTSSTQTVSSNKSDICDCSQIQEGGWEITCYSSNADSETSQPEFADEFNIVPFAFFIRYEIGRQVKITCDNGVPLFRPALFQGLVNVCSFLLYYLFISF